jgi:ribosomal protein L37E
MVVVAECNRTGRGAISVTNGSVSDCGLPDNRLD